MVVRQLLNDGVKEELLRTHIGSNREALVRHLYRSLRGLPEERLICVFADLEGFLIAEEILADGLEDLLPLSPRRIFRRALNLNARRLVLAHNHPSGCSRPSDNDIRDTRRLAEQARGLGIVVEDHFVVGHTEVVSMKHRGLF
jgi:DNA repair protein RadC